MGERRRRKHPDISGVIALKQRSVTQKGRTDRGPGGGEEVIESSIILCEVWRREYIKNYIMPIYFSNPDILFSVLKVGRFPNISEAYSISIYEQIGGGRNPRPQNREGRGARPIQFAHVFPHHCANKWHRACGALT